MLQIKPSKVFTVKNTVLRAMFHKTEFVRTESAYNNGLNISAHRTNALTGALISP
jgi:hypothetical protein